MALYTRGLLDRGVFKENTGIEVKKLPVRRKVIAVKQNQVVNVGNDSSRVDGSVTVPIENEDTHEITYYRVDKKLYDAAKERGISIYENGGIKNAGKLYAQVYYIRSGDYVGSDRDLADAIANHYEDFERKFGTFYSNVFTNYLTSSDAFKNITPGIFPSFSTAEDIINNYDVYVDKYGLDETINKFYTARNTATEGLKSALKGTNAQISFEDIKKAFPDITELFGYTDSKEDKIRQTLGIAPEAFDDDVLYMIAGRVKTDNGNYVIPDKWTQENVNELMAFISCGNQRKEVYDSAYDLRYNEVMERETDPESAKSQAERFAQEKGIEFDAKMFYPDNEEQQRGYVNQMRKLADRGYDKAAENGLSVTYKDALAIGQRLQQMDQASERGYVFRGVINDRVAGQWDESTGFVDYGIKDSATQTALSEEEVDGINDIIAEQRHRMAEGEAPDEAELQKLRDRGLNDIADFILSTQVGDVVALTDKIRKNAELEILTGASYEEVKAYLASDEWQKKLDTAAAADRQVRENSDFADVIANAPSVNTEWNPYFPPTADDAYCAIKNGYQYTHNNIDFYKFMIEQYDNQLARGEITQKQHDDTVAPIQKELETYEAQAKDSGYGFITKEMYDTFTYLYVKGKETGDYSAFSEYFNIFKEELTNARFDEYTERMETLVKEKPWIGNPLTQLAAAGGSILSGGAYVETLFDAATGQEVDTSSPSQLWARSSTKFTELAASQADSEFGKWIIRTGINLIATAPAYLLGPAAGAGFIALQAAGKDAAQLNYNGASALESLAHSSMVGGITFLSSMVMLKGFQNIMAGTTVPATVGGKLWTYGLNALKAFGLGTATGAASTLTINIADMYLLGDKSRYAELAREYMDKGMTEENAMIAAGMDIALKEPVMNGLQSGAIAAMMSIPGTAGAIEAAEAKAAESRAFETAKAIDKGSAAQIEAVKANVSEGMALLEKINERLRQESGIANSEVFKTETAHNELIDLLKGKGNPATAAETFKQVADEAIASGKLTEAEVTQLNTLTGKTKVAVDAMALLGDNGVGGRVLAGMGKYSGKPYGGTRKPDLDFTNRKGESTLNNHYSRHGDGFNSADEYKSAASNFLVKPPTLTTQSFISDDGTYFRYDTATNEFGIMNKFGGVSTYYRPREGVSYWIDQINKYAPKF